MDLNDGLLVVLLAFLSGVGNKFAAELIDYMKKKRHTLKNIVNGNREH